MRSGLISGIADRQKLNDCDLVRNLQDPLHIVFAESSDPTRAESFSYGLNRDVLDSDGDVDRVAKLAAPHSMIIVLSTCRNHYWGLFYERLIGGCNPQFAAFFYVSYYNKSPFLAITG